MKHRAKQARREERRWISALAAYVFALQALIVAFIPTPSRADFDLAASFLDICRHDGTPVHVPVLPDEAFTLVGFYVSAVGAGDDGSTPSEIDFGLFPFRVLAAVLSPISDLFLDARESVRTAFARGPPVRL
ncbi:hypothetical protein [Beijerinckia mobilis]|uniref:hypothetical protein n=1 Tax=Beijerinckia mobilis TaxID=231434 RepID=UPI00055345C8|nr:hypothetical protein [Beijerinckia mobilis]